VREDPQRRGLLFAGTERAVYVSFDDGGNWESVRLNMPATSVRDLIIKDDDVAVATHGRGFWILDNITPLRQLNKDGQSTALFKPQTALRVRWSLNTDTPLPPDEPMGENPPDGAIIDYFLSQDSSVPVTLEIKDNQGNVVRRYSSDDRPIEPDLSKLKIPRYWIRPPQQLSVKRGMHRFLWDMHYAPVRGIEPEYPMNAIQHNTAPAPTSPWAVPGDYTVTLTVNGKIYTQPLTLKMDPRVKMSAGQLQEQFQLSLRLTDIRTTLEPIGQKFDSLVEQLSKLRERSLPNNVADKLNALNRELKELGPPNAPTDAQPRLDALEAAKSLFNDIQGVDADPTSAMKTAVGEVQSRGATLMEHWKEIIGERIPALNQELKAARLPPIDLDTKQKETPNERSPTG